MIHEQLLKNNWWKYFYCHT